MLRQFSLTTIFSLMALTACGATTQAESEPDSINSPKNIIMIVSDGMGPAYTTAYRNYMDDPDTPTVEPVVFDKFFVGNASTYPAKVSGYVTDSAASATALASGVKSYNGAIGVDTNKQKVLSVLQYAKEIGMRTGIAVTSQIVHATPASYVAHNESRQNYNQLADSYYDDRINGQFVADVMLGGGTSYFERSDRDLVAQFIDGGYEYVDSYNRLASLPKGSNVLGLFAPVGLPWVLDDTRKDRLAYLTKHAIKHLENDNGYFLLVEASQVDWAGHGNDVANMVNEMDDLAKTIEFLDGYVQSHPDTLVVLTADHSTGGLTIGADGKYLWEPQWLKSIKASPGTIGMNMAQQDAPLAYVESMLGFTLTEDEKSALNATLQKSDMVRSKAIKTLLDKRTNTGWTTGGHTGIDVEIFAFGAGSNSFIGQWDNTDIAKKIFGFLANKKPSVASSSETEAMSPNSESTAPAPGVCDFKTDWRCQ